ncbi:hypothetical protein C2845_PM09G03920 [Panicum miliaceum]|uniref:Uncharacterized protein n=1 Tax=Panicum miliaceum TaxID=4540 RepID=A0A3L6S219_PANMI|nr:hypothetical protein C2845_PM09G03920 [Panicum miliaceum]
MNLVRMAPMNFSGAVLPSPPPRTILRMPGTPPPPLSSCENLFTSGARSWRAGSRGTVASPSLEPRRRPTPPSFWMDGSIDYISWAGSRGRSVDRSGCSPSQATGGEPAVDPCGTSGPTTYISGNPGTMLPSLRKASGVGQQRGRRRRRWKKMTRSHRSEI